MSLLAVVAAITRSHSSNAARNNHKIVEVLVAGECAASARAFDVIRPTALRTTTTCTTVLNTTLAVEEEEGRTTSRKFE